jgi:hypothetical protein
MYFMVQPLAQLPKHVVLNAGAIEAFFFSFFMNMILNFILNTCQNSLVRGKTRDKTRVHGAY